VIPVKQTETWNCMQACIASIFELDMSDLPTILPEHWFEQVEAWALAFGMGIANFTVPERGDHNMDFPKGWSIGGIPSPTQEPPMLHAVVCWHGKIVWDPLTGKQPGTEDAVEYLLFYLLNPLEWKLYITHSQMFGERTDWK